MPTKSEREYPMYHWLRLCNCADCGKEMIGKSVVEKWRDLSDSEKERLPPMMGGYMLQRPYCYECLLTVSKRTSRGARPFSINGDMDPYPGKDGIVKEPEAETDGEPLDL